MVNRDIKNPFQWAETLITILQQRCKKLFLMKRVFLNTTLKGKNPLWNSSHSPPCLLVKYIWTHWRNNFWNQFMCKMLCVSRYFTFQQKWKNELMNESKPASQASHELFLLFTKKRFSVHKSLSLSQFLSFSQVSHPIHYNKTG